MAATQNLIRNLILALGAVIRGGVKLLARAAGRWGFASGLLPSRAAGLPQPAAHFVDNPFWRGRRPGAIRAGRLFSVLAWRGCGRAGRDVGSAAHARLVGSGQWAVGRKFPSCLLLLLAGCQSFSATYQGVTITRSAIGSKLEIAEMEIVGADGSRVFVKGLASDQTEGMRALSEGFKALGAVAGKAVLP